MDMWRWLKFKKYFALWYCNLRGFCIHKLDIIPGKKKNGIAPNDGLSSCFSHSNLTWINSISVSSPISNNIEDFARIILVSARDRVFFTLVSKWEMVLSFVLVTYCCKVKQLKILWFIITYILLVSRPGVAELSISSLKYFVLEMFPGADAIRFFD